MNEKRTALFMSVFASISNRMNCRNCVWNCVFEIIICCYLFLSSCFTTFDL